MSEAESKLSILIDIKARLDEIAKTNEELRKTKEGATGLGELFRTGLGIGTGMEIARRGIEMFKATVVDAFRDSFRLASEIKDGAENLMISREAYQVLGEVMRDVGGDQSRMTEAIATNNRSLIEARQLVGAAAAAYRTLGLDPAQLEGMAVERRFEAIGNAVARAKDKTEAFSAAGAILGSRNLPALLNALKILGTEGYDKLASAAEKAGRIMGDDTVERLEKAQKAIENWKLKLTIGTGEAINQGSQMVEALNKDFWAVMRAYGSSAWGNLFRIKSDWSELDAVVARLTTPNKAKDDTPPDNTAALENEKNIAALRKLKLQLTKEDLAFQATQDSQFLTQEENRSKEIRFLETKAGLIDAIADATEKIPVQNGDDASRATEIAQLRAAALAARIEAGNKAVPLSEATTINRQYATFSSGKNEKGGALLSGSEGLMAGFQQWAMSVGSVGQQIAQTLTGTIGGAISTVSQGITGLITGTATWGDMGRSVGLMFLQTLVQVGVQMVAQKVIMAGVAAFHALMEGTKTAATATGTAARSGLHIAETVVHGVQVGLRVAAHLAGEVLQTGITIVQSGLRIAAIIAESMVHLVKAAIGALGAMASIPYVGPILAIAAMAAVFAAGSNLLKRENGGEVRAGVPYLVGEKRPEVFVPTQNGTIIPSVDQYRVMGSSTSASASASRSGGVTNSTPIQEGRRERTIVFTGDLMKARNLMRDSDWDNVFVDAARRNRGEALA